MKWIKKVIWTLKNASILFVWACQNPLSMNAKNFKLLSDLLTIIFKVAEENRPYVSHIGFVNPPDSKNSIVSIWAGAGTGADPINRIEELAKENNKLKAMLAYEKEIGMG